jgi:hypothetical protein
MRGFEENTPVLEVCSTPVSFRRLCGFFQKYVRILRRKVRTNIKFYGSQLGNLLLISGSKKKKNVLISTFKI